VIIIGAVKLLSISLMRHFEEISNPENKQSTNTKNEAKRLRATTL
jgi:hypothetical protein